MWANTLKDKVILSVVALTLCAVPVSSSAGDGWAQVRGPSSTVLVTYSRAEFCWQVYAEDLSTGDIHRQNGSPEAVTWTKVGGPAKEFASDGTHLYGLSLGGTSIWRYTGSGTQWQQISGPMAHIYAGGGRLFATSSSTGDIYEYGGQPFAWTKIGTAGKTFAVDDEGVLYAISPNGDGVWRYGDAPSAWHQIGGPADQIYAGGSKLYATNPNTGNIYEYSGQAAVWKQVGGPGQMFAVDDEGHLFGLSMGGASVRLYKGTPMQWEQVGGAAGEIYAGGNRRLYATNPTTSDLWHRMFSY